MINYNIKPCPFCSGKASVIEHDCGYTVECNICGASYGESQAQWRDKGAEAIKQWNNRPIENALFNALAAIE